MRILHILLITIILISLSGCIQTHTDNPEKALRYWTQIPLSNSEVKAVRGQYWRSAHFTLEYEAYLQLVVSKEWRDELIRSNNLQIDTTIWYCPKDVPNWFYPPKSFIKYQSPNNSQLKFWMQQNGDTVYIYDLQL